MIDEHVPSEPSFQVEPLVQSALQSSAALNLAHVLERLGPRHPDREVLIGQQERMTWADLIGSMQRVSTGLRQRGIQAGDRVGVILQNRIEFLEIFLGVIHAGAVFVPMNFRLAPDELSFIAAHSGVKLLLVESGRRDEFTTELFPMPIVNVDDESYQELIGEYSDTPAAPRGEADLQRIMYTSGTTGRPKGVMITHGGVWWKTLGQVVEFGLSSSDVFLASGPLYHVGTFDLPGITMLPLAGKIVVLEKFDPEVLMQTVQDERVTVTFLAPSMMNMLLAHPRFDEYDLSSLRIIIDGSEKMPASLLAKIPNAFPNAQFFDGFGMTETITGDSYLAPPHLEEKLGSVGTPTLGMEMRVVDDHDDDTPVGVPGELAVRGPKLCVGYWNDPVATQSAFQNGWFHTGDIAVVDEDGFYTIVDRKKDMIISGGENIASAEVERALYDHDDVLEAAVIGQPHERWGEVPIAYVVPRPGIELDLEELRAHCRSNLAGFKVPAEFHIVKQLPRNPSGKVLKHQLRTSALEERHD